MFKKILLTALIFTMVLALLPAVSVQASTLDDDPPSVDSPKTSNERLENIWAREQRIYDRIGNMAWTQGQYRLLLMLLKRH